MPGDASLRPLAFPGRWRRYQELALESFERDRAAGRRPTHLVAPPGRARRCWAWRSSAASATVPLVLCPNSAVQAQWLQTAARHAHRRGGRAVRRPGRPAPARAGVRVGTRALLGEGWDAPCVNCLVDLTQATTGV